ncbi:MAG: entericidin A/B family lipoprotein [Burkholderiales bacterium]|nr:entericidin A/B family lipoprotein [Burkholderiales bacterium]
MNKMLIALATLATALALSACNTFEGLGKDISKAGDKIEETAKKNK